MSESPSPVAAHAMQMPPQIFLPVSMGWHFALNAHDAGALCIPEPDVRCGMHCDGNILRRGFVIANQVLAEPRLPNPLGAASINARVLGSDWVGERVSAKTKSDLGNFLMELARAKRNLSVLKTTAICISNQPCRKFHACCPFRMNHRNRGCMDLLTVKDLI